MEYIQADIWVRFQRMQGHDGALRLRRRRARRADHDRGREGRQDAAGVRRRDRRRAASRTSTASTSRFDNWHSTDAPENHELAQDIYRALRKQRADRDARPSSSSSTRSRACSCPTATSRASARSCGAKDQYGDTCEVCGAVYAPTDLKNPYSTLTGATPVLQEQRALLLPAVATRAASTSCSSGRQRRPACSPRC